MTKALSRSEICLEPKVDVDPGFGDSTPDLRLEPRRSVVRGGELWRGKDFHGRLKNELEKLATLVCPNTKFFDEGWLVRREPR